MAEGTNVGAIYYTTTLDTQGLIDGRRRVEQELQKAGSAGDALQTGSAPWRPESLVRSPP